MITEKYCNEILQQYPEYITKDQMYRICHISKKTCLFLLESGLVPNIDSGKKTRRFKIKTVDVIQYLKDRDDYPELFKAPDGFYKGKGGDKKAPSFDEVFTQEDLIRMRQYYERLLFCRERNMFSVFYDFGTVKIYLAARQLDNRIFAFITSAENGVHSIDMLLAALIEAYITPQIGAMLL